jgi:hypothetical protein
VAADGHVRKTSLVGLVALLDLSEDVSARYSWVRQISVADVSADAEIQAFNSVNPVTEHGKSVLAPGGKPVAYSNMASYGLHIGSKAAARTLVAAVAGTDSHQSVLVMFTTADNLKGNGNGNGGNGASNSLSSASGLTLPGGDASRTQSSGGAALSSASTANDPTLTTDKPDYQPGDTVTFSGTGWMPGDTLTITVHEDPTWSFPDRQFVAVVGADGSFTNRDMIVDTQDLNATFTATAVANPSGLVAQMTFTDSKPNGVSAGAQTPASVLSGVNASYVVTTTFNGNASSCTVTLTAAATVSPAWPSPPAGGFFAFSPSSFSSSGASVLSTLTVKTTGMAPNTYHFNITATPDATCQPGGPVSTTTPVDLVVTAPGTTTTVSAAAGSFGGTVNLSAHVEFVLGGNVSGATVTFSLNGTVVGSGTTNGGGNVTLSNASLGTIPVGTYPSGVSATVTASATAATSTGTNSLTVNPATQTLTVTGSGAGVGTLTSSPAGINCTSTAGTTSGTCSFAFANGAAVTLTATPSTSLPTAAGSTFDVWSGDGTGTTTRAVTMSAAQNVSAAFKANQAITFTSTAPVAAAFGGSYVVTATGGGSGNSVTFGSSTLTVCTVSGSTVNFVGVGTCTVTADQAGNTNYNAATQATQTFSVAKANQTITFTKPSNMTFGDADQTLTASASSGLTVTIAASPAAVCSIASSKLHVVTAGTCTVTASQTGNANYNAATDVVYNDIIIAKANQTITFGALAGKTFGDPDFAVSATSSSTLAVTFSVGASDKCTITVASVHLTGAGSCTVTASQAGNDNYNAATPVPQTFTIGKATATITVTPYSVTYDGAAHTATATATGVGGVALTGFTLTGTTHTNAGTYATDAWSFSEPSGNYNDASGTVSDAIAKATATIVVTPYSVTYDGAAHTATGTATGVLSEALTGLVLTGTTHTNAGTYNGDAWTFTNANYADQNGTVNDAIAKANATIVVTPYNVTYDAAAHTATGTAKGVLNENLSGLDLSATTHTNAGTYAADAWAFTDASGNYNNTSGTTSDAIGKAAPTIVVTPYNVTFDGAPHTATGTAKGVQNETLSGLVLTGTTHTNAGTYATDPWTFTDATGNYQNASGTTSDAIGKATATIVVTPYSVTYDATAHTASGTATGVGGVSLAGLNLSGTTHTNAGTYNGDAWTFTDASGNYSDANGTVNDAIAKATATVVVTGYSVTYDGAAHSATGTAKGVGGVDLTGLDLSGTTHTNAGTYNGDAWTFTNANYNDQSGTVNDAIGKANATIIVTPYSVTYDALAHTATGTAKGVGGINLSGLDVSGTTHTNAGTFATDPWTFTDVTGNYNNTTGTVSDAIAKADASITVTPYSVTFDAAAHTATGTAKGVQNETLSGLVLTGTTHTNAGDYTTDPWTFTDATGKLQQREWHDARQHRQGKRDDNSHAVQRDV